MPVRIGEVGEVGGAGDIGGGGVENGTMATETGLAGGIGNGTMGTGFDGCVETCKREYEVAGVTRTSKREYGIASASATSTSKREYGIVSATSTSKPGVMETSGGGRKRKSGWGAAVWLCAVVVSVLL